MSFVFARRATVLALAFGLGACKKENPCPAACETASKKTGIDATDCTKRCTEGKWDEAAVKCVETAQTAKDATRCDPDVQRKLRKIQKYLERQQAQ